MSGGDLRESDHKDLASISDWWDRIEITAGASDITFGAGVTANESTTYPNYVCKKIENNSDAEGVAEFYTYHSDTTAQTKTLAARAETDKMPSIYKISGTGGNTTLTTYAVYVQKIN